MSTVAAFPAPTLYQQAMIARAIRPAIEHLRHAPTRTVRLRAVPTWRSGDRCHWCDRTNWLVGRGTAECAACGCPAPLSNSEAL